MSSFLQSLSGKLRRAAKLPPRALVAKLKEHATAFPLHQMDRLRVISGRTEIRDAVLQAGLTDEGAGVFPADKGVSSPSFPVDVAERESYCKTARELWPDEEENCLARGDEICRHIFDLLGSGEKSLGPVIDWHRDFKSGFRWPKQFYRDIVRVRLDDDSDIKATRELSRFQHFTVLGKAFWFSGDERYAREFQSQILHWIEENPFMGSVNWDCTMDVAIRAVNWLWGYAFFRDSAGLDDAFRLRFLKSLLAHGRFIRKNLEYAEIWEEGVCIRVNGNHYLSDLVGLIFLGVLLPELREASEWREFAASELWRELEEQVFADGVSYEASFSYNRLSLELFLTVALLCKKNDIEVPANVWKRLDKMVEFVEAYIRPDGRAPQVGDADDGRLQILGPQPIDDHRYLLTVGAVLFGRSDFKEAAGEFHEEALWLLGPEALETWKEIPCRERSCVSQSFPDGGIYVMRQGDLYLLSDCGNVGMNGQGSHDHSDPLSFELYAYDQAFIVDPGSYIYSGSAKWRNLFRSVAWHNTVRVDGEEANRFNPRELFAICNDAKPEVTEWETGESHDFLDARHFGYARLADPVIHRRRIYFEKDERSWFIRDDLDGGGEHDLEWFFHFAAGVPVEMPEGGLVRTCRREGSNLVLKVSEDSQVNMELYEGWVSRRYGMKKSAQVLRISMRRSLPVALSFILVPFRAGERRDLSEITVPKLMQVA